MLQRAVDLARGTLMEYACDDKHKRTPLQWRLKVHDALWVLWDALRTLLVYLSFASVILLFVAALTFPQEVTEPLRLWFVELLP